MIFPDCSLSPQSTYSLKQTAVKQRQAASDSMEPQGSDLDRCFCSWDDCSIVWYLSNMMWTLKNFPLRRSRVTFVAKVNHTRKCSRAWITLLTNPLLRLSWSLANSRWRSASVSKTNDLPVPSLHWLPFQVQEKSCLEKIFVSTKTLNWWETK